MALTTSTAIEFIAKDEQFLLELLFQINSQKIVHRHGVEEILERYIIQSLTDDNGYLLPDALKDEQIDAMQAELVQMYSPENLDAAFSELFGLVNQRLSTIDEIMVSLELEEGILGAAVFEMETVQQEIGQIAQGLVRGAEGDGDYVGSIERIEESMNRYRFDKSKPELTLRTELMETLEKDANAGKNHSNSVALTTMATIDRELRRVQALEAGVEHGLYSGAHDDLIRPFCDQWLGQVMSWAFWDSLANDMPPGLFDHPVSKYGGGINCRHRIMPWELDWSDGETDLRSRFAAAIHKSIASSRYPLREFLREIERAA